MKVADKCKKKEFAIAKDKTLVRYNGSNEGEVIIPENVSRILYNAFKRANNINNFVIPSSVEIMDNNGQVVANSENIKVDKNNKNFSDVNGVLFNKEKDMLLVYPKRKVNKIYNIPDGVKSIAMNAFSNAPVDEVIISDDVEIIGQNAFEFAKIKKITVPENVKEILENCFFGCEELEEITLKSDISIIKQGTFSGCKNLKSLEIPNTVEHICGGIVDGCDNLEYIAIPKSVKKIENSLYGRSDKNSKESIASFTLYVEKGSYAEEYAKEYGYKYKYYDFENHCAIE